MRKRPFALHGGGALFLCWPGTDAHGAFHLDPGAWGTRMFYFAGSSSFGAEAEAGFANGAKPFFQPSFWHEQVIDVPLNC